MKTSSGEVEDGRPYRSRILNFKNNIKHRIGTKMRTFRVGVGVGVGWASSSESQQCLDLHTAETKAQMCKRRKKAS